MSTTLPNPESRSWFGSKARELFGLDVRSLALFRIGMGLMLILDLLKRSLAFKAHYTGEGIVPVDQVADYIGVQPIFQIYMLSDEPAFQAALFVIQGAFAVCFMVGYRTRLMALLSTWMLVALQRRNPLVCHTGDALLSVLMVWAVVLPLGAAYSIDQLRRPRRPPLERQHLSISTLGFCVQIACFYFMAGWFKAQEPIWQSGEAVVEFTKIDNYVTWFGALLAGMPAFGRFLNDYTLILEEFGWLLFFFPFFTPWVRMAGILLYVTFHLGLHLSIFIGILELASIVAVCTFLPATFWDVLLPRVPVPAALRSAWGRFSTWCTSRAVEPVPLSVKPLTGFERTGRVSVAFASLVLLIAVPYFNHDSRNWYVKGEGGKDSYVGLDSMPLAIRRFVRATHIAQHWLIFTNLDERPNGWYLALGERDDGEVIDMFDGSVFEGVERPERPAKQFVNHNMRRIWHLAVLERYKGVRPLLGDWLIREWNRSHDQKVSRVIVFMMTDGGEGGRPKNARPIIERSAASEENTKAAWLPFLERVNRRLTLGVSPAG